MPGRSASSKISFRLDRLFGQRQAVEGTSLACGHMRELEEKQAHKDGMVHVVAIDQDAEAVRVAKQYANVECRQMSIRQFLLYKLDLGNFDLVYAAGLYDYLDRRTAAYLTKRLYEMLAPNGRLIIPNFLSDMGKRHILTSAWIGSCYIELTMK